MPPSDSPPDFDLRRTLETELSLVRAKDGWRAVDLELVPRLLDLAEHEHGERSRKALQDFLLDRLDPVATGKQREDLGGRDRFDTGLMMRWVFGEPSQIEFGKLGDSNRQVFTPARMDAVARRTALEKFRGDGTNTIFRPRSDNRKRGGDAWERLQEILDELVAHPLWTAASTEEAESDQPGQHDGANDEVPTTHAPKRRGLGTLRRFRRKRAAAVAAVSVVALGALVFAAINRKASSDPPGLTQHADLAIGSNKMLATGLLVQNKSLKSRWQSSVRADPPDDVSLAATIHNRLPYQTPPLTAWIEDGGGWSSDEPDKPRLYGNRGRAARLVLADTSGNEWGSTPYIAIHTWKNVDQLMLRDEVESPAIRVDISAGSGPTKLPSISGSAIPYNLKGLELEHDHNLQSVNIGSIPADHTFLATIPLRLYYNKRTQFGSFAPTFGISGTSVDSWRSRGAAAPGDELEFHVYLDNQGNFAMPATIWVTPESRRGGSVISVTARGSFGADGKIVDKDAQLIGSAKISSRNGNPIELEVIPGSTRVKRFKRTSRCTKFSNPIAGTIEERLPDGIETVGVDLASFGGITFHSDCVGTEFNQSLYFKARVVSSRL